MCTYICKYHSLRRQQLQKNEEKQSARLGSDTCNMLIAEHKMEALIGLWYMYINLVLPQQSPFEKYNNHL